MYVAGVYRKSTVPVLRGALWKGEKRMVECVDACDFDWAGTFFLPPFPLR